MNIDGKFKSIGKAIFVKYYYDFKNCTDRKALMNKLYLENPQANSINAQDPYFKCTGNNIWPKKHVGRGI